MSACCILFYINCQKKREILDVIMLAEVYNSCTGTIWTFLTNGLDKIKVCVCFVPHQINENQKKKTKI